MSTDRFRSIQCGLRTLRAAWATSPQARGGPAALRGFSYQMTTALAGLLRVWLAKTQEERNEPHLSPLLVEGLSDWTEINDSAVIACQVKRMKASHGIHSALAELWSIDSLARLQTPELAPLMRYRLIFPSGNPESAVEAVERWAPDGAADSKELMLFKRRVTVHLEPDPESEVLALLANHLQAENPLGHLKRWLGELFRGADTESGFDEALLHIWNDLQTLVRGKAATEGWGYLWTAGDKPPAELVKGEVLTGQRPGVRHLREGYFADRSILYEAIAEAADEWISQLVDSNEPRSKLPVFWIEGRSGTGKSVALLHVLSRLYARGRSHIAWLADKFDALPRVVRWCRPLLQEARLVIAAIDDPYAPTNQEQTQAILDQAELELLSVRESEGPAGTLLIVCCGPTEQRVQFKKQFAEQTEVNQFALSQETRGELRELWEWFCMRRTKEGEIPYPQNADVLLVQLFFEWQANQRLAEFASRFRKRIWGMDGKRNGALEQMLSRMLAMNRLYVGYPAAAVREASRDPEFEAHLDRLLNEERHLKIESDNSLVGLKLAHPHLSNAIYNAWFDSHEDEPRRRAHLRDACRDAMSYGESPKERTGPLWGISRLGDGQSDKELLERLPRQTLAVALPEIFKEQRMRFHNVLPTWLLPVWLEMDARFAEIRLSPSPLDEAISRLERGEVNETGTRLMCHKLLAHLERYPEGVKDRIQGGLRALLSRRTTWREWPHVAMDYCKRTMRGDLSVEICEWVERNSAHPLAGRLLETAVSVSPSEPLFECAKRWLGAATPAREQWVSLWRLLRGTFPKRRDLAEVGYQWLATTDRRTGAWTYVWQEVFEWRPQDELFALGAGWLEEEGIGHRSWPFVWERLWAARPRDEHLEGSGRDWLLGGTADDSAWAYAFLSYAKECGFDAELTRVAIEWLLRVDTCHPRWGSVLTCLHREEVGRERLVRWLEAASVCHPKWPGVWLGVQRSGGGDARIVNWGLKYLMSAPTAGARWCDVWHEVYRSAPEAAGVLELGRRRIGEGGFQRGDWLGMWQAVLKAYPDDDALISAGHEWLEKADPNRASWRKVWLALRKARRSDPRVSSSARAWLSKTKRSHRSWGRAWLELHAESPGDQQLLDDAQAWLNDVGSVHGSWGYLWAALARARGFGNGLAERGRWFLRQSDSSIGSWFAVWEYFVVRDGIDGELGMQGVERLQGDLRAARAEERWGWARLFMLLWAAKIGRSTLRGLGREWLLTAREVEGAPGVASALQEEGE